MSGCGCNSCNINESDSDPNIDAYKVALKNLGIAIKSAHKSEEGKKLSTEYWTDIVKLLKKAKLGVSMMELGIDDEEEIKNTHDATIKKVKPTPDGAKGEGGPRDGSETSGSDSETKKNESISEKASSKSQQRLFGMVHAYNKGELEKKDVDPDLYDKIKKIANGMTQKDAKKIAKTDHTDLPEKVPTNDVYDKLNHLTILLAENSFENIDGDGTELHISKNERKFTIKYDDSFYMVSENYNFDLGCEDVNDVVSTFIKLSNQTETALKEDYRMSIM